MSKLNSAPKRLIRSQEAEIIVSNSRSTNTKKLSHRWMKMTRHSARLHQRPAQRSKIGRPKRSNSRREPHNPRNKRLSLRSSSRRSSSRRRWLWRSKISTFSLRRTSARLTRLVNPLVSSSLVTSTPESRPFVVT